MENGKAARAWNLEKGQIKDFDVMTASRLTEPHQGRLST